MDEKDAAILDALLHDSRMNVVKLSRQLGIPRATVQERIKKLVESGVIRRFTAKPDYKKLGLGVTAYIFVAFAGNVDISQRALAEQIANIPGVYEVSVISGEWDILLKVRTPTVEDVGNLVIDRLRALKGVLKTETCVSFQSIKEE
jgi:Lrp/AsnC family leucine-responsive transcriptional regulator